jgi:deaminated glutathione amidase
MRIAVLQYAAGFDKAENTAVLTGLATQAAQGGADLVVAPEGAMHDFGPQSLALAPVAEPLDGPFVSALGQTSSKLGVTIVAGMFESVPGDPTRAFNTVVAVGPTGSLIGTYRKQHLFDALGWTESERLASGATDQRLLFECADLIVGVLTCYDIRFPELARVLVGDGATMLVVPSAWVAGPGKAAQLRTLATARAIENVCYVATAVQTPPSYTGRSAVIDPFGDVLGELGTASGVRVVGASAQRVAACRARMPSLQHRRWRVEAADPQ